MNRISDNLIKCIVVDDEPMARDIIKRYIEQMPNLQLMGEFGNAIEANIFLQSSQVDIIFLDIRMPQLNGTDFVRSLYQIPKIIFTTAHKEYAHEGFELDVVDYLLKPIRFDRFLRAVSKAFPQQNAEPETNTYTPVADTKPENSFIYLKANRKMIRVVLDDILYIESIRDYVKVVKQNSSIISRQTISSIEVTLPEDKFFRIHRSYIISIDKIKTFTHEIVEIGDKELPIGKLYRNSFLKRLGN